MTPDPLQQIREALTKLAAWLRSVADGREEGQTLYGSPAVREAMQRESDTLRMAAEDLDKILAALDGLRLLPDGHAAVPESVIERILGPSGPLCTGCEPCLELAQELRASLAGGRGNE